MGVDSLMHIRFPKPKLLNAARQKFGLELLYPHGRAEIIQTRLLWRQTVKPSPFGRCYGIEIEYQAGEYPITKVIKPGLRSLAGERKLPHVYPLPGDPLCLYYAPAREWNPAMSLAKTIIPWTCEWLFHFEAWLVTDQWDGGGVHI